MARSHKVVTGFLIGFVMIFAITITLMGIVMATGGDCENVSHGDCNDDWRAL